MKSPLIKIVLACLLVLFLSACVPVSTAIPASPAVQIPLDLKMALNAAILFGVMFGLQWLFETVKIDLRGVGAFIASAVAEFLILQLQGWIDVVPAQYDVYVLLGLNIILTVLTTLGYIRVAFRPERAAVMFNPNAPKLFG